MRTTEQKFDEVAMTSPDWAESFTNVMNRSSLWLDFVLAWSCS